MKFYTAVVAALVATALPVLGKVETTIRATGPTDHVALHNCLSGYRTDNWDGEDCGGRGWFKGSSGGYKSPQNCYDACQSGISSAIDSSASDVICHDYEGGATCYMGFH
ncbi:hypothetical protein K474DRAFT_1660382 [Panus rudis PR-1116 ss-1]|nr:hypothetical protein K474DRAFT_1660382 [Panus rudis PR-1116 ss-1]